MPGRGEEKPRPAMIPEASSFNLGVVRGFQEPPHTNPPPRGRGFLFAVEDLERNDGSAEKPYFMSQDLRKLLKKTNKGQPEA